MLFPIAGCVSESEHRQGLEQNDRIRVVAIPNTEAKPVPCSEALADMYHDWSGVAPDTNSAAWKFEVLTNCPSPATSSQH
jgi:hypothetical protein